MQHQTDKEVQWLVGEEGDVACHCVLDQDDNLVCALTASLLALPFRGGSQYSGLAWREHSQSNVAYRCLMTLFHDILLTKCYFLILIERNRISRHIIKY